MRSIFIKRISLLLLLLISVGAAAQNNPYNIDDEVYSCYMKADAIKHSEACLAYVDSALAIARSKGDRKGECVVESIPLSYYIRIKDTDNLHQAAEHLRKIAKEYGYNQYYHHAYSQEITLALTLEQEKYALELCKEQLASAEKESDDYGIFIAYKNLGKVYQVRRNIKMALSAYNKAIEYFNNSTTLLNTQSISQTYSDASRLYISVLGGSVLDTAFIYVSKAQETAKTYSDSTRAYASLAQYYIAAKDTSNFYSCFNRLKKRTGVVASNPIYRPLMVFDAEVRHEWKEALSYIESASDEPAELVSKSKLYEKMGMYKEALSYRIKYQDKVDSLSRVTSNDEMSEYIAALSTTKVRLEAKERQMHLVVIIIVLLSFMFASFIIIAVISIKRSRQRQRELISFNEQLSEAKDKAESASRMKSLFVQNMSHEVRTPLNAIMGFSQLLTIPGMDWSNEEKEQYGRAIMTNGNMLTMLIDDILNIADLESGNYTIRKEDSNVRKICSSVSEVVEFRLPSDVEYKVNCDIAEDYTLYTDAGRVQQILVNFLTNACKHTEKGSITLDFKVSDDSKTAIFRVTDTGTGIPKEKAEKIFERFEKLDSFKQGTGIGLHLCNMLSIKLGGKVYVDTSYTNGARFVLELPVVSNKPYDPLQCYLDMKAKQQNQNNG